MSRRRWLRRTGGATVGIAAASWAPALAAAAANDPKRTKSIIVLWLAGGPATIDLWDLKPGHDNGGPFREIPTATPGIRISEHLPLLAKRMNEMAVVRSMATREGDHGRATYLATTGYVPQGALQFPAFGSLVSNELGDETADLPGYVSVVPDRDRRLGGGFLGPRHSPLVVDGGGRRGDSNGDGTIRVPDLAASDHVTDERMQDRLDLLTAQESEFVHGDGHPVVDSIRSAGEQAVRLMQPDAAGAFRIEDEPDALRHAYGRNEFGQGCLLARRLVERGVPFVDVTLGGWDTHQENFDRVQSLSSTLDAGFATLMTDLAERGMLDSTVILCLGEFGRTPRINGNAGRDHWPLSWSTVLAGGGVPGGRVVGETSADGMEVVGDAVTIPDLLATVCKLVGIDPMKQNMSNVGRPIRIADPEAAAIEALL